MSIIQDYQRNSQPASLNIKDPLLQGSIAPISSNISIKNSRKILKSPQTHDPNDIGYISANERNLLSSIDQELKKITEKPDYRASHRLLNDIIQNRNDELQKAENESENQKLWSPYIVLLDSQKKLLEDVFKDADAFDDGTVQKYIYLHALRNNKNIIKIIHAKAIQISDDNYLNLEEALDIIENDGDLYEEITFNQFMEYFDLIYKSHSQKTGWISERTETLLENKYLKIIKNIFDALPKWDTDKVSREEFIFALFDDPQVQGFLQLKAREDKVTKQTESVEDVLNRIDKDSAEFLKWNDIVDFFCSIGAPKWTLKDKLDMMDFERKYSYDLFIDEYNKKNNHKNEEKNIQDNDKNTNKSSLLQKKNSLPQAYKRKTIRKKDKKLNKSTNAIKTEIFITKSKGLLITRNPDSDKNQLLNNFSSKEKLKYEMPKLEINKFKAKPPPPTNNIPLYNHITQQLEDERKLRIESAAKKSLEEAKQPIKRYEKTENKYLKPARQSNKKINTKNQSDVEKFWEEFNKDSEDKNVKLDKNSKKWQEIQNFDEKSKNAIFNGFESMLIHKGYTDSESLSTIRHILGEEELDNSKKTDSVHEGLFIKAKNEIDKQRLTKRINHPPLVSDLLSSLYETSYPTNFITTIKQKMINRGIQREKIIGEVTGLEYVYAEDLV